MSILAPHAILLVAGGWSPERVVSLRGAEGIATALGERGHQVTLYDLNDGLEGLAELAASHDVAFLNLHGAPGEDGLVQALLDEVGCPYQGSGPAGSFLALHKAAAKTLFCRAEISTPDWLFLPTPQAAANAPCPPFPLFVKPNRGGSSLLSCRVDTQEALTTALDNLFAAGEEALVEHLLSGQEVTCGILDPTVPCDQLEQLRQREGVFSLDSEAALALPPVLIIPQGEFFDFHNKYADDGAEELCPAPLEQELIQQIQALAIRAHRCLGLRGYSRADFILSEDGLIHLLEVNTLPGMTTASLLPREAAAIGLEFGELLELLLLMGLNEGQYAP